MNNITVDFSKQSGVMKPLHGMNNAPVSWVFKSFLDKFVSELGTPYFRLHDARVGIDVHIADISGMFPDFSKDENDPLSYEFAVTDLYIKKIVESGSAVFFRLGQSIEWGPIKRYIAPPSDYEKWARICEHVILHYNEGWADGFDYGIKYWEIWNEPEMPPMWLGTPEDFYRLYDVTSKHLKQRFPHLSIGGYASCGFPEVTRKECNEHELTVMPLFHGFLDYIKEHGSPIDFFSWHIYSHDTEEIISQAAYAKNALNEAGLSDIETFLTEWNHFDAFKRQGMAGACYVGGALCALQCAGTLDGAMYYAAASALTYNGLYDNVTKTPDKPYYAFSAFNTLYKLGGFVMPECGIPHMYACAAKNDSGGAVMIVNSSEKPHCISVNLNGLDNKTTAGIYILDADHDLELMNCISFGGSDARIALNVKEQSIILIETKMGWE